MTETAHGPWQSRDDGEHWSTLPVPKDTPFPSRSSAVTITASPTSIHLEASLRSGVLRNGVVTLPHREVWSLAGCEVEE